MSRVASKYVPSSAGSLVLPGIDWRTYSRLLRVFAGSHGVRLTYDRGSLEIMSPLPEHEDDARFLGRLVTALTEEFGLPLKAAGSTTLRRQLRRRGIEADESFWIANAPRMQGRRRLDLRTDPPPDLAVEVDVSRSSLDRLSIYAVLGVPEVWRLDGDALLFYVLNEDRAYTTAERSRSFPLITPVDLLSFIAQARQAGDQNPVVRDFRIWVRQQPDAGQDPPSLG